MNKDLEKVAGGKKEICYVHYKKNSKATYRVMLIISFNEPTSFKKIFDYHREIQSKD